MIPRIPAKRLLKRTAGWAAQVSPGRAPPPETPQVCIHVYHRIAKLGFIDPQYDDWNVPPARFEQHVAALAETSECLALGDLPDRLAKPAQASKPLVCLTFDDGYANFYTEALPVLRHYGVPAALGVVTGMVGSAEPMPFDAWSRKHGRHVPADCWRSLDWAEIEACVGSGLVTLVSHSHRHAKVPECSTAELIDEATRSRAILHARFGDAHAQGYVYPYGCSRLGYVPSQYVQAVRDAGYRLAMTTDLGLATAASDPYRLPRVEAHGLDTPGVLRAKARGSLAPFHLINLLRSHQGTK